MKDVQQCGYRFEGVTAATVIAMDAVSYFNAGHSPHRQRRHQVNHADQPLCFAQDDHITRRILRKLPDEPLEFLVASGEGFVAAVIIASLLIGKDVEIGVGVLVT